MPRTLTNLNGLHSAVFAAMNDPSWYGGHGEKKFRSVTGLLKPPFAAALEDAHEDEIVEDAMDGIWMLMGSAMHGVVERGAKTIGIAEDRLKMTILGETITGGYDLLWEEDGVLTVDDFKFTSVWSYVFAKKHKAEGKRSKLDEWEGQLNLYVLMLRRLGFDVKRARVCLIFRDWTKSKAQDPGYPPPSVIVPLKIWTEKEQTAFAEERVRLHKEALEPEKVPEMCSSDERWQQPAKYAVMKPGAAKATRVLDSEEEALKYIAEKKVKGGMVVMRPGRDTRCEDYCPVNKWCPHFMESSLPF